MEEREFAKILCYILPVFQSRIKDTATSVVWLSENFTDPSSFFECFDLSLFNSKEIHKAYVISFYSIEEKQDEITELI